MIDDLAGLEALIDKRAKEGAAQREREAMWKASVRAHRERRREEYLAEWRGFHEHMATLHAALSEDHRARAEALLEEPTP